MLDVPQQALHGLHQPAFVKFPFSIFSFPFPHLSPEPDPATPPQADQPREDAESQKWNALGHRRQETDLLLQIQLQSLPQEIPDSCEQSVQFLLVVAEHQHIVHVAKVSIYAQFIFDKVVQMAQVEVGQVLARQVADGEAFALGGHRAAGGR